MEEAHDGPTHHHEVSRHTSCPRYFSDGCSEIDPMKLDICQKLGIVLGLPVFCACALGGVPLVALVSLPGGAYAILQGRTREVTYVVANDP